MRSRRHRRVNTFANAVDAKQATLKRTAKYSLMSMPSVMYLITVDGPVQSSKRIVYPTSWPKSQPNSSATLLATLIAATRRGCVQPIMPLEVKPISAMYCVICVVFPEPVSPITTRHWWSRIASINSLRSCAMGKPARCSLIVFVDT